jgi:hypothetical protein
MFCDIIHILVRLNKGFLFIVEEDIEFRKLMSTEYNIIAFYIYYNYRKLSRSIAIDIQLKKKQYIQLFPCRFYYILLV